MSSFASPIPPPVFDSDESDVASQQSTDSSYVASQFNRGTRLSFSPELTLNSSNSQVLPPSSTPFDESTCGSGSQSLQDDSHNYSRQSSQQDFILNDSINIESTWSRLTTLPQTPSEISCQSSPISSHLTKSNEFESQLSMDHVSLETPNQSPCTRRKNLDYVQESTFLSPKRQRRSRHHDVSINLPSLNISNHEEQLTKSKGDLVNTNPFRPQLDSSQNIPSDCRQSSPTVPVGSPSFGELSIQRFHKEFHRESELGRGEFSHVYLCTHRLTGVTYAIKSSKQAVIGTSYAQMPWREACAHAVLIAHENLVRYYSAWTEPDGRFFVQLEYCKNGSLQDILEKNRQNRIFTSEQQLKHILHQISDALAFMHAQDLAHLDIKPANIMLSQRSINLNSDKDDMIYKLTDFGHVSKISSFSIEEDGDSRYLALEALQKSNSQQLDLAKCDIFSLGLTLYVCATNREMPKEGDEWEQLRLNITQYLYSIPHCTHLFNALLLVRMCHLNHEQRPSANELLLNPVANPTSRQSDLTNSYDLRRRHDKTLFDFEHDNN